MPPNTPQDAKALRQKVLSNEKTAAIARNLGVSIEAYTDRVVHFLLHPRDEPELYIVEDQDLRSMGLEPPNPEEMGRFVAEAVNLAGTREGKTEFAAPRQAPVQLRDPHPAPVDSSSEPTEPDLASELQKSLGTSLGTPD